MLTAVVLNLFIKIPLHMNTFGEPKMYYIYAIKDEYSKIHWELAEKPRLRTALCACSMNGNRQTNYQFSNLLNTTGCSNNPFWHEVQLPP